MSQTSVLDTAGINTSPLTVKMPTTTSTPISLPMSTSTLSGSKNNENTIILKRLDEIKIAINDGFAQLATKINDIGLKQHGGRRTRKKKGRRGASKK